MNDQLTEEERIEELTITKHHKNATDSFVELKEPASSCEEKIIGSYNAHFINGGSFRFFTCGGFDPAILSFNEDSIKLSIGDSEQKSNQLGFRKEESQVIWIGTSGRRKDFYTWLKVKDSKKACLISIFSSQPNLPSSYDETKQCANEFYSKMSVLGFKTEIEAKRRGLFMYIFGNLAMFIAIIFTVSTRNWFPAIMLSSFFVYTLVKCRFEMNGPDSM